MITIDENKKCPVCCGDMEERSEFLMCPCCGVRAHWNEHLSQWQLEYFDVEKKDEKKI